MKNPLPFSVFKRTNRPSYPVAFKIEKTETYLPPISTRQTDEATAIFKVQWKDGRARLANILAMATGIKAGEIQGLRVQNLRKDCLYIRHSWNRLDGLKVYRKII